MRLHINHWLPLTALIFLPGCALGGGNRAEIAPPPALNGPAADYPMVIGDSFTIGDTTFAPADTMNYDAVGYASIAPGDAAMVAGAHKILPLPSYVEVTSLENGKTILVRLTERGPMVNDMLIELSAGAAAQLGLGTAGNTPVRVRRVNPPELDRAMLRKGGSAPERMATPQPLLNVLKRKLKEEQPLVPVSQTLPAISPAIQAEPEPASIKPIDPDTNIAPVAAVTVTEPAPTFAPVAAPVAEPEPASQPVQAESSAPTAAEAGLVVQVGAFSTEARAKSAAAPLEAGVSKPGKYWLVQLGPYADSAEAQAGLEKARAAGYSDARIQRKN